MWPLETHGFQSTSGILFVHLSEICLKNLDISNKYFLILYLNSDIVVDSGTNANTSQGGREGGGRGGRVEDDEDILSGYPL